MGRKVKFLYLSLALLCVACAHPNDNIQDPSMFSGVDPKIQVYFDRFTQKTGVSTAGITAGFTSIGSGVAGQCVTDGPYREIRMDTSYWNSISNDDAQLEQLTFHELGHCALGLGHIGTMVPNIRFGSIPGSIMNPMSFGPTLYYPRYESYYVDALVHNTVIPSILN